MAQPGNEYVLIPSIRVFGQNGWTIEFAPDNLCLNPLNSGLRSELKKEKFLKLEYTVLIPSIRVFGQNCPAAGGKPEGAGLNPLNSGLRSEPDTLIVAGFFLLGS